MYIRVLFVAHTPPHRAPGVCTPGMTVAFGTQSAGADSGDRLIYSVPMSVVTVTMRSSEDDGGRRVDDALGTRGSAASSNSNVYVEPAAMSTEPLGIWGIARTGALGADMYCAKMLNSDAPALSPPPLPP